MTVEKSSKNNTIYFSIQCDYCSARLNQLYATEEPDSLLTRKVRLLAREQHSWYYGSKEPGHKFADLCPDCKKIDINDGWSTDIWYDFSANTGVQ